MAARHTRLSRAIWDDPDFAPLTAPAKLLYLHLISSPKISLIGALDHTPGRWARATSLTREQVDQALAELEDARFVLVDLDSEEIAVRSFVRHDVQVTNPKMAKAVWSAWSQMGSASHRVAILDEIPEPAWIHAPDAALNQRQERERNGPGTEPERQSTPDPLPPPSPTSLLPPPSERDLSPRQPPVDNPGREAAINQVLQAIADHTAARARAAGQQIRSPRSWRAKVIRNARDEHLDEITRLLDDYPDAPASLIAGAVLGEDARNLTLYRTRIEATS